MVICGPVGFLPDAQDSSSVMSIVAAQRDRFRSKNLQLEGEIRHLETLNKQLRDEVDGLRSDNIKLYERIKFIETYNDSSRRGGDEVLARYADGYEEGLSPFQQFSTNERQRKLTTMHPADKVLYSVGRLVLGNKIARLGFLGYIVILHFLTFFVLYKYSHSQMADMDLAHRCQQMVPLPRAAQDHINFDSAGLENA
ncbi:uncharacterized protein MONBRDRAFT_14405 [Monosiga brevicollis MX1]|uniref:CASP C-terminal domain-containing protein n=1 Tax=Monosiga brevicollis TaxID=81824 RepID=A9USB3_MONBE|nr:uncharacterized protein MONBRDRAFT_14405 [Monosiga brevicollis MX1]EDQ91751.1 predicted protein [Monosiga brevicollis MX1]|eukprot:XP_001743037.1 hypothetical protein [Monosiga brevicollis MX1]